MIESVSILISPFNTHSYFVLCRLWLSLFFCRQMHYNNAVDTQITSMAPDFHEQQCLMDTQERCTDAPDKKLAGRKDPHVIEHDSLV